MKRVNFNLKNLFRGIVNKINEDDVFALASQLAYYLVLSFFPFMLFLMTLAGFSKLNSREILVGLDVMLPKSVLELTQSTIREIFDTQYTGLLWVSILLMMWSSFSTSV